MKLTKIALLLLIVVLPVQSFAADNVRKITVIGESETTLEPHYAIIKVDMQYVNAEMNQSHAELIKSISKLTSELNKVGLTDKDIRKSFILQGQQYSWKNGERAYAGYYSACYIDLYVREMNNMAAVYRELAHFPSVTIQKTIYKRNDEFEIIKAEFEKALQKAKKKAEYMCQTLNAKIGKVYSINENDDPIKRVAKKSISSDEPQYGNVTITANIVVEFELE